jgi:hypothetical protein
MGGTLWRNSTQEEGCTGHSSLQCYYLAPAIRSLLEALTFSSGTPQRPAMLSTMPSQAPTTQGPSTSHTLP